MLDEGEQCRARCVPDRTVIPGISRSLRDKPPDELTCGYEAKGSGAYVLLSCESSRAIDVARGRRCGRRLRWDGADGGC